MYVYLLTWQLAAHEKASHVTPPALTENVQNCVEQKIPLPESPTTEHVTHNKHSSNSVEIIR